MFVILVLSLIICTNALETRNNTESEIQRIFQSYLEKIPDIESKYVLNEALSKSISKFFKEKISVLPLFKMSVKIDRTPIKIPWTVEQGAVNTNNVGDSHNNAKIEYKYVRRPARSPATGKLLSLPKIQ
ncbi:uncharacterized protein LOC125240931 [Leguminivora glycinivorella]|uniref:uncharacterized protein LOC125240931 n=1 Tax=Leguminivora glycinivorella TaxID=1035111 RepID=UPI0020108907|nr:uncharacterized protein LOC125240931 [Leguminivora glycinivorella]